MTFTKKIAQKITINVNTVVHTYIIVVCMYACMYMCDLTLCILQCLQYNVNVYVCVCSLPYQHVCVLLVCCVQSGTAMVTSCEVRCWYFCQVCQRSRQCRTSWSTMHTTGSLGKCVWVVLAYPHRTIGFLSRSLSLSPPLSPSLPLQFQCLASPLLHII